MIQDISPRLNNIHYAKLLPDSSDIIMHFVGKRVLACTDVQAPFPSLKHFSDDIDCIYGFSIGEQKYFIVRTDEINIPDNFSYIEIKDVRHADGAQKENVFAMFTAFHLFCWYKQNRFCGVCGAPTAAADKERAILCTKCSHIVYPRINPAVIVGVKNQDKILITRYAKGKGVEYDALIGGFVEIGETLEETVSREVMEEVGLKVKNICYYKSQPWGYSGGMLTGFYCDVDGDDTITLDENELGSAKWVNREDIVGQPDALSLTNEMMSMFKNGKK